VLRCWPIEDTAADVLPRLLQNMTGVKKVEMKSQLVHVTFDGPLMCLVGIERTASECPARARFVSPARLVVKVTAAEGGGDPLQLEVRLSRVVGVRKVTNLGATAEILADLRVLTMDALKAAAAPFKVEVSHHESIHLTLAKGTAAALEKEMLATEGVLTAKAAADGSLDVWAMRGIGNDVLKLVAQIADAEIREIKRR